MWGGVITLRRYDSSQGSVKDVRKGMSVDGKV